MTLYEILTTNENLKLIEEKCSKKFPNEIESDECYVWVIDNLQTDDYKRLKQFQSKNNCSIKTFLCAVVNNLIEDFRRHKYGRKRYPKLIQKFGKCAEAVYKYVCWGNYTYDEAFEFILAKKLYTGDYEDFIFEAELISTAPCNKDPQFIRPSRENDPLKNHADDQLNPLDSLIEHIEQDCRSKAFSIIKEQIQTFTDSDKLLVRMVFGSDNSVAHAARVIGIKPAAARKQLKRILLNLKEKLLAHGIRSV